MSVIQLWQLMPTSCSLLHCSEADRVSKDKKGSGTRLGGSEAPEPQPPFQTRRTPHAQPATDEAGLLYFEYAPIKANRQKVTVYFT